MSAQQRATLIPAELSDSPDLLGLSPHARLLFYEMMQRVDDEGRARADPVVWRGLGHLSALRPKEVATALDEVCKSRLVGRYEADGSYLFIAMQFEWRGGVGYWTKSNCPLPDAATLMKYPNYLAGLRRLSRKGRLHPHGWQGDPKDARYPELWTEPFLAERIAMTGMDADRGAMNCDDR